MRTLILIFILLMITFAIIIDVPLYNYYIMDIFTDDQSAADSTASLEVTVTGQQGSFTISASRQRERNRYVAKVMHLEFVYSELLHLYRILAVLH